jgi:two-component system chemotaxis response regulator CheB
MVNTSRGGPAIETATAVRRELAVVGASAGGVEALTAMVRALPADIPLAFVVVLHMPLGAASRLPAIVGRAGRLPAVHAADGGRWRPGRIYVAPPDRHVVVDDGRIFLLDGPRENGFRPAIDPLFRSAARSLGARAIGVLLSGTMDDGVAGLAAIEEFGGAAVVQDPADAVCGGLPEAALEAVPAARVASASGIAGILSEIGEAPVARPPAPAPGAEELIVDPMELPADGVDLTCPDCGGALQRVGAASIPRFRCRVGHVFSSEALLNGKGHELEAALWAAVRTLEETATVSGGLAQRSRRNGSEAAARRFDARQADAARRADLVRQALESFEETINETTEDALADLQPAPAS